MGGMEGYGPPGSRIMAQTGYGGCLYGYLGGLKRLCKPYLKLLKRDPLSWAFWSFQVDAEPFILVCLAQCLELRVLSTLTPINTDPGKGPLVVRSLTQYVSCIMPR